MNRIVTGQIQEFKNPIFHGGEGATLEIRAFTLPSLFKHFAEAGFAEPLILKDPIVEYGIYWLDPISITMIAKAI